MKEEYEQIALFHTEKTKEKKVIDQVLTDIFQDPRPLSEMKGGKCLTAPDVNEVSKGRVHIIDDIIASPSTEAGEVSLKNDDFSEITNLPVETRMSLSYSRDESEIVSCSRVLTNFDREVIDAVATLATKTQIMTDAMIYRVIIGKGDSVVVSSNQKQRVAESMIRCSGCRVVIDITAQLESLPVDPNEESVRFAGNAINFISIEHKIKRGSTTYYKISEMPPFYLLAAKLGKISMIPLRLLDSPVSKTDNVIAMQSFLLREIDTMKRDESKEKVIHWNTIYQMAAQEGKGETRQEKQRTRDNIQRILDFWVKENFIKSYDSLPRQNIIAITF